MPLRSERVATALANALADPRGRWLLGPQRDANNEYRLTAVIDGERRNLVIDRSFTDRDGKRWIVDYKTSGHEGADVEGFLDREQERYRAQLARYAAGARARRAGDAGPVFSAAGRVAGVERLDCGRDASIGQGGGPVADRESRYEPVPRPAFNVAYPKLVLALLTSVRRKC